MFPGPRGVFIPNRTSIFSAVLQDRTQVHDKQTDRHLLHRTMGSSVTTVCINFCPRGAQRQLNCVRGFKTWSLNWKNTKMCLKVKCQKLRITSSVSVTGIPIKPQKFPASSFWVCSRALDLGPMTLKLNRDLDILKMYLPAKNEVARLSHSKYIARVLKKYENSSHGQKSPTSNHFLAFTTGHIPTKLQWF